MIREMSTASIMVGFDMSTPKQLEGIANIGLICFIVVVMCVFGLLTSSSISVIALQPLERMLTVVRERCSEIFKYTQNFDEETKSEQDEDEDYDDIDTAESSSEFALLERVVKKLTAIAHASMIKSEPEVREDMGEDEVMTLNWMQGTALPTPSGGSHRPSFSVSMPCGDGQQASTPRDGDHPVVNPAVKEIAPDVQAMLETESFDAFVDPGTLASDHKAITLYVIQTYEGCDQWVRSNVQESHLFKFIEKVDQGYNVPTPWHNYNHALDVLHQASRYMTLIEAHWFLSEVSQFWVMIACIGHDLGHIGVNNQFLVETSHELALRYNDRSPLENMHCARLFQVVGDPQANIFAQIEKDLYKEMRKGIIAAILHTDIVKHNEMMKELNLLYQMNSDAFDALEPNQHFNDALGHHTQLVLNMLLHGADMSNPMRPWKLCEKYAGLIMEEFFCQGDQEKERGIPIQVLNDREKVNRPNSQVGFIEFMIAPMAEAMVNLFSPLDSLVENLACNITNWSNLWIEETLPTEEAIAKVRARVEKTVKKLKAVTRVEKAKSLMGS